MPMVIHAVWVRNLALDCARTTTISQLTDDDIP